MNEYGTDPIESSHWLEFAAQHVGHPALDEETVYALPTLLIEAIEQHAPGFLTTAEKAFERDLAACRGAGFFLKRIVSYPLLSHLEPDPPDPPQDEWAQRRQETEHAFRKVLADDTRSHGRSEMESQGYFDQEAAIKQQALERQRGYAGWLATEPEFWMRRAWFCERWRERVRENGEMPTFPASFAGERPEVAREDREFYSDYMLLYRHWSLDSLATWDLPVPMRPELAGKSLYHFPSLGEAGLTLFVPWYLLSDQHLSLQELAGHHLSYGFARHLQEWLSGGPSQWGHERFGVMLALYVYLELALRRRYGRALRQCTEKLDRALAEYVYQETDSLDVERKSASIRKIRQEMDRRLERCRQSLSELEDGGPAASDSG